MGVTLRTWITLLHSKTEIESPEKLKTPSKYKHVFQTNE